LILRRWRERDLATFATLNLDPEVMRHFPSTLTPEQSAALVARIEEHFDRHGFGLWAVTVASNQAFIGYTGLAVPRFEAHFTPAVEVGWRLARGAWGRGYATEAARAALAFGFETGLEEIVSFTVPANIRSVAVMERIGMSRNPDDDFDNPTLPEGSPLRRHVLYRISKAQFEG
jgi:ribosomal-protein-alanine N-acetyltransferase